MDPSTPLIIRVLGAAAVAIVATSFARPVVARTPVQTSSRTADEASSPAASPNSEAEEQTYTRYRRWVASLPPEQRREDLAERYREVLQSQGASAAEINSQLRVITTVGPRIENERWNRMFTAELPRFNAMPNAFMVQVVEGRMPGRALDVGMGVGRNALWLARQGWEVTGFDPADRAVAQAKRNADALGLTLDAVVARAETFEFGENRWDLIVLSYVGCSQWARLVERALKPGGLLVLEAFHGDATKEHRIGGSICQAGELPAAFQGLRSVRYEEPIALPDFAQARMRLVRFAGQKP